MTQALTATKGRAISEPFKWKTSRDEHIPVASMETRHLFNTVRMIWNHTMPRDAALEPYRRYAFGPFYTPEYMKAAIYHIMRELKTRQDITDAQRADLDRMASYVLAAHIILLIEGDTP